MARASTTWQVTIANTGQTIACGGAETILHAAVMAGIDYPYTCATGNCGSCLSHLDTGKTTMLPRGDAALSPSQIASGQILACRAQPKSDISITWLGRGRK
jgi:ferredoxin